MIAHIPAAIEAAQERLGRALVAGEPTREIHAEIEALRDRAERAGAEAAQAEAKARQTEAEAEQARAAAIAERVTGEAAARLQALRQRLADEGETPVTDATDLDPSVVAATESVAKAEDAAARATAAARVAETAAANARTRQHELRAERQVIVDRRARGDRDIEDGPVLSLLDADIDALTAVIGKLDAEALAASAAARSAVQHLDMARLHAERAELVLAEPRLVEHAEQLAERLLATVAELRTVRDKRGGGLVAWRPTENFATAIRALELQWGW